MSCPTESCGKNKDITPDMSIIDIRTLPADSQSLSQIILKPLICKMKL